MPLQRLLLLLGAWFAWPIAVTALLFSLDPARLELVAALALLPSAAITVALWDPAKTPILRFSRWPGVLIVLVAMGAALLFTILLSRYWAYFHLATPSTTIGLIGLVLPASFLILTAMALASRGKAPTDHIGPFRAVARPVGIMLLTVVLMFSLELVQSAGARSGEGEGAGDLGPFFASLFPDS